MNPLLRILLVDDSRAERELILEAVRDFAPGLELRAVATPEEATRELSGFAPSLVLLDLHLGRHHGRDLLSQLRGSVGAVILTTTDNPVEAHLCQAAGALGFWIKPMKYEDFPALFRKIHELAGGCKTAGHQAGLGR